MIGAAKPVILGGLEPSFVVHKLIEAKEPEAYLKDIAPRIRGLSRLRIPPTRSTARSCPDFRTGNRFYFGVGYDHVDAKWAAGTEMKVTNSPEVYERGVADTALGLLLCTLREFPPGRTISGAGKWVEKAYPLHGDVARPHRWHCRHGPHRQGDRDQAGCLRVTVV